MTARPQVELPELRKAFERVADRLRGKDGADYELNAEGKYRHDWIERYWQFWRAAIAESEARAEDARRLQAVLDRIPCTELEAWLGQPLGKDYMIPPTLEDLRAGIDAAIAQEAEREAASA